MHRQFIILHLKSILVIKSMMENQITEKNLRYSLLARHRIQNKKSHLSYYSLEVKYLTAMIFSTSERTLQNVPQELGGYDILSFLSLVLGVQFKVSALCNEDF